MMDKRERVARRILEAERLNKKHTAHGGAKKRWLKIACPKCGRKIEFSPKENWNGELYCVNCGIVRVSLLDHFIE